MFSWRCRVQKLLRSVIAPILPDAANITPSRLEREMFYKAVRCAAKDITH